MVTVSEKSLRRRIGYLNKVMGFKGHTYHRPKSGKNKGKLINKGSGFSLGIAYGGYRLEFITKTGGYRDVSNRGTKNDINQYIHGMLEAVRYYKDRTKLR